ncbi:MAG: phosphatidate cytidylyltransferase [Burkholderiales bacterium]
MLRQRVITALMLLAVFLPALFAEADGPFRGLTLALVGAAAWEWGLLNGASPRGAVLCGSLLVAFGGGAWFMGIPLYAPSWVWWAFSAVWLLGGAWALKAGVPAWSGIRRGARISMGLIVLASTWWAISMAKMQGALFLLSVFVLVWIADVAAYAGGRIFGRRKLAVTISPGKSWEGVYCGVAAVTVMALVWAWLEPAKAPVHSLYFHIFDRFGPAVLVCAAFYLAILSIMGDLLESLVKRAAGMKDSSQLLPGHGGVLDRIDALLPVFPAALALASL